MTKVPTGGRLLEEWVARNREQEKNDEPMRVACSHCGITITGRYEWAHRWFRLHRARYHPDIKVKKRNYRPRVFVSPSEKSLRENVLNARASGAGVHAFSHLEIEDEAA